MGSLRECNNFTELLSTIVNFLGFTNTLVPSALFTFRIFSPNEFASLSILYELTSCKNKISKNEEWVYEEYDMFCSYECMKKPVADKCCICKKDIPRRSDWIYPLHCSIFCATINVLTIQTILPIDIIKNISNKIG